MKDLDLDNLHFKVLVSFSMVKPYYHLQSINCSSNNHQQLSLKPIYENLLKETSVYNQSGKPNELPTRLIMSMLGCEELWLL